MSRAGARHAVADARPWPHRVRRLAGLLFLGALHAAGALGASGCAFSGPPYRGAARPHFDGEKFHNPEGTGAHGGLELLRWLATRKRGFWRDWVDEPPGPPPPARVDGGELRVTFVNHATALVQMDGLNILTDPIWSERPSPVSFAGPRRVRPPGLVFEDLPKIDVVLVSHNHYDHCDLPTLRRLAARDRPRILVGLGNRALLAANDVPGGEDLDWWSGAAVSPEVTVFSVPSQHFSARGLDDRDETMWTGFVISGPSGRVYFAGDTGYGPHFRRIGDRFGPLRLALLPIGAFRPEWFMGPVHVSPGEAVRAHDDLGAATSVAIHFGTFPLADDAEHEPVEALERALREHPGPRPRFWVLGFGEGRMVPALPGRPRAPIGSAASDPSGAPD